MILAAILTFAIGAVAPVPPQAVTPPDQLLTAASLEKLKKVTLSGSKTSALDAAVVKMLGMAKQGETITVKQFKADTARGLFVLTVPVKPASPPSDDLVFSFRDLSGV